MMTHRQRCLIATRGEMPDILPYTPRIDLWYNANSVAGTLPKKHQGRTQDEISRAEGWGLHKIAPEFLKARRPEDNLHRAIGLFSLKEFVYDYNFSGGIEIKAEPHGEGYHVEYHTPLGTVSTTTTYTKEMRKAGASLLWTDEHIIKKPEDYRVVEYIFENLELIPDYDKFVQWQDEIGDDGIGVAFAGTAASPMHHIQKELLDATAFYYHYKDYYRKMRSLAERVEHFFDQALRIVGDSPAEVVHWGGNFDDMITYPPYFEREILPWIRKASDILGGKDKLVLCHCDGENFGLMDLIRDSGMHVAESICPYPMTKVKIEEYYERWTGKLTIWGGIPSNMLLAESTTEEEFEAHLDHLFQVVAPGRRFILGIADTTPPNAVFERLIRIGERVEKEGRLPLEGGAARPISKRQLAEVAARVVPPVAEDERFEDVREDIFKGNHTEIREHVQQLLDQEVNAQEILQRGMLSAMEVVGERFKTGEVFIPEVLLSARAMNEAVSLLEPYLASTEQEATGKVLIGTVQGDLHDIGKNLVGTMLHGVGFEVRDLGANIAVDDFVRQVAEYRPDILGLSALLTTTMPEMKKVIDALDATALRGSVKVMVGGAPVNEKFARDIGADGYAPEAGEAVELAKKLMEKSA